MRQTGALLGVIAIICVLLVASQVFLKLALQRTAVQTTGATLLLALPRLPAFWLAIAATAAASLLWVSVVRSAPLSTVYPMVSLSYVLMVPVARLVFGEAVTVPRVAGAAIIVIGVAVLSRSL